MCSQNGKQGTGKLVARHSTRQKLGDRACGSAQKGTVSMGLAVHLALPLQCVHTGRRFPVAGCLWCSVCSVCLCNAGGQYFCHCLCSGWGGHWHWLSSAGLSLRGRVGTQYVRAVSQSGVGGNGKEQCVCSEQREQYLLAQGVGLPSDCAAEGRCCAYHCSVLGLCSAAAPRSALWGMSALQCRVGSESVSF